jgi:hypothetical protein
MPIWESSDASGTLEQEWIKALNVGLKSAALPAGIKIDVPFYGDRLADFVVRRDLPPGDEIETRAERSTAAMRSSCGRSLLKRARSRS